MLIPEKNQLRNKKMISAPWIIECIEEKFESAITMLEDDCIIYGGALRDLLAYKEIGGDLDIIVPLHNYFTVVNNFMNSSKWIEKEQFQLKNLGYSNSIIGYIHTFINIDEETVQLMSPNKQSKYNTIIQKFDKESLKIVEQVDIKCCGIMSNIYGNVYEIISGAYKDCITKELNLNEGIEINSKKQLEERIKKLERRGWKNNIDISDNSFKIKETIQ